MDEPIRQQYLNGSEPTTPNSSQPSRETKTSSTQPALEDSEPVVYAQRESWMKNVPCLGLTHLFFSRPDDEERPKAERGRSERISKAKGLCRSCPVRESCLDWALRIQLPHGIAGGLTYGERRPLLRERAKLRNNYGNTNAKEAPSSGQDDRSPEDLDGWDEASSG